MYTTHEQIFSTGWYLWVHALVRICRSKPPPPPWAISTPLGVLSIWNFWSSQGGGINGVLMGGGGGYHLDGIVPVLCRLLRIAVTMADIVLPSIHCGDEDVLNLSDGESISDGDGADLADVEKQMMIC